MKTSHPKPVRAETRAVLNTLTTVESREPHPPARTVIPIEHDSDWVRLPKPQRHLCGLGKSHLYQLCKRGVIKSVALREPGKARGVRLLYKPSILAFIEGQSALQNATEARSLINQSRHDQTARLCEGNDASLLESEVSK